MKTIKQPEITQKELNRIIAYHDDVEKYGYKPWNTIRQSHTYGQGQEILNRFNDRTIHLYSRGERQLFVLLEAMPNVIDIKEQFPLPLNETLDLASELNIKHPGAYKERFEHDGIIPAKTMTSDLVVTFRLPNNEEKVVVYSFKYQQSLDYLANPRTAKRTWEKLKLEREYWKREKIDWVLMTEQCYSPTYIYNLEYLRECFENPELLDVTDDFYQLFIKSFRQYEDKYAIYTLRQILEKVSDELNLELFHAQALFQKATYFKDLKIDLFQEIELFRPLIANPVEVKYAA
ncbi:TnsA endonuclease N-terminal domain-containing protein [Pseudoalteromonas phenolica]|uniref:TnsA endonuclease N-terminal domain-containing protein n=1 Tax=Pseudoalteromonas phenolica TaxID=161398 RepID=UPI00384E8EA0